MNGDRDVVDTPSFDGRAVSAGGLDDTLANDPADDRWDKFFDKGDGSRGNRTIVAAVGANG